MRLSEGTIALLLTSPWHGNIREMEKVIGRAVLLSAGDKILPESLLIAREADNSEISSWNPSPVTMQKALFRAEKEQIIEALRWHNGNKSLAARSLDISRSGLYNKLKRYQIATSL